MKDSCYTFILFYGGVYSVEQVVDIHVYQSKTYHWTAPALAMGPIHILLPFIMLCFESSIRRMLGRIWLPGRLKGMELELRRDGDALLALSAGSVAEVEQLL